MARVVRQLQPSFTRGELDPKLAARTDFSGYYDGANKARNVEFLPQGGFRRRPGLEHIEQALHVLSVVGSITATAPNGGTANNAKDQNTSTEVITTTNISTTNPYVVVHYDLGSAQDVVLADVRGLKITAGTSANEFRIQYSTDDASWNNYGTAFDSVSTTDVSRRRGGAVSARYWRVVRVGATDLTTDKATLDDFTLWTESATLSNVRVIPFVFSTTANYLLLATDRNLRVYKNGVAQADVAIPHTSAQLPNINWTQSLDTLLIFHEDVQPHNVTRLGADDEWKDSSQAYTNIPDYDFGSGDEDVWSDTRGWPRCGTFHDGRGWYGGSASRPQTFLGSKSGDFFNMDTSATDADYGINVTADTDDVSSIYNIFSGNGELQIFSSSREFQVRPSNEIITPTTVFLKPATRRGSEGPGLRVVEADGGSIFLQRGGAAYRELLFVEAEQRYAATPISLLASHLIRTPVDHALRKSTSTDEADLLVAVNTDGTMTTLLTLRDQNITAWALWTTDGLAKAVGIDLDDIYVVVERENDDGTERYLERFNRDHYYDASVRVTSGLPTDTVSNLDHLEGLTVPVRADEAILADVTVASGSATIARDADDSIEIGRDFVDEDGNNTLANPGVLVETMPVEPNLPDGTVVGRLKRITEVVTSVIDTQYLEIDGDPVVFRTFGESGAGSPLDASPPTFTGNVRDDGKLGYDESGQIRIGQTLGAPMIVRALAYKVAV